jgi:putative DNA primase/helicase
MLPSFWFRLGRLRDKIPEAELALQRPGMKVFIRGGQYVRPHTVEQPTFKGGKTTSVEFFAIDRKFKMMNVLSQAANWLRLMSQVWLPTNPDTNFCSAMVENAPVSSLPITTGITTIPVFRYDGSLVTEPGLDPATGIFLAPDPNLGPLNIPDRPTRDDAMTALNIILPLFDEFPFVEKCHKSAAVSAALSPLGRTAMETCPLHIFTAPKGRTGKTFAARLCGRFALPDDPPAEPWIKSEEEFRKRIDGWLMAGSLVRMIDNADGEFDSVYLNSVLTNRSITLRVLKETGAVRVTNNTCFYGTGNNLTPIGAMVGKTIECKLNPNMARPQDRKFSINPLNELSANRAKYLSAAYTVLRAHACAGFPGANGLTPLNGFDDWSRFVRGALVWLDLDDPVSSQFDMLDNDPEETKLQGVIAAWEKVIGVDRAVTTKDLFAKMHAIVGDGDISLKDAFEAIAGERTEWINHHK